MVENNSRNPEDGEKTDTTDKMEPDTATQAGNVTDRLTEEASQELQNAHEKQAMALAIEAGELTPKRAKELLDMDELAVVQSEYYPADEFYDQAAAQLRRQI